MITRRYPLTVLVMERANENKWNFFRFSWSNTYRGVTKVTPRQRLGLPKRSGLADTANVAWGSILPRRIQLSWLHLINPIRLRGVWLILYNYTWRSLSHQAPAFYADLAQLVELLFCNQPVGGSNPSVSTNFHRRPSWE